MADRRSQGDPLFTRVARFTHREGKRVAIGIVGGVIVIAGIVLMPLPGPGMLIVLAGLAVLGTQFEWAQDLLDRARERARDAFDRLRGDTDNDGQNGDDGERPAPSNGRHRDSGAMDDRSDVA